MISAKELLVCDVNGWLLLEIRLASAVKDILTKQLLTEISYHFLPLNTYIALGLLPWATFVSFGSKISYDAFILYQLLYNLFCMEMTFIIDSNLNDN